jgi:type IX secretion system PorP/SprF family membrane protein
MKKRLLTILLLCLAVMARVGAQEESPFITYDVPAQNLLKFNRFLINPTFSTVREDKSYINLLHRNQSVQFDDNDQSFFLSYSGRISDRTGLGLSLYSQREGLVSNYGILANYAYGIKLSDKSNFTFGANLSYYNSGFDENRANPLEPDPLLNGFVDSSLLSFQPGFNISYGAFDFGLFAENLFDYNLKTNESVTDFKDKTYSGHLQYTYQLENSSGIFESGRIMPLMRVRKVGQDDIVLGGSLILDLPKLGWIQGGYDSFYGAAAGIGFNLNRRLSIGYTMEKGLSSNFDDFGLTHEISFAYSFTPTLTEDRVMLEDEQEALAEAESPEEEVVDPREAEIADIKKKLAQNDSTLTALMLRQDSLATQRDATLEKRFEAVMRMIREETAGQRPDLERKAWELYFRDTSAVALQELVKDLNEEKQITREAVASIERDKARTAVDEAAAPAERVKTRKFNDLQDVDDGYYLVANVYKGTQYLNKFVNGLKAKGIAADYIDNKENGLKYVYLQRFNSKEEALEAYHSGLGGAYSGDLWIMHVDNRYSNEAYAANKDKIKEKSEAYENNVLQKNIVVRDKVASQDSLPKSMNISGLGTGYYIIANVFANPRNANRFVKLLNARGLSASYFINPVNNYRYVYLKRHESWNNALISYYSKLNNAYDDKMWIMRVTPNLIT